MNLESGSKNLKLMDLYALHWHKKCSQETVEIGSFKLIPIQVYDIIITLTLRILHY